MIETSDSSACRPMAARARSTRRRTRPLAVLAVFALIIAGCTKARTDNGSSVDAGNREKAVEFAQCMRDNGVQEFPDPDASGQLTLDGVANGSSVDPSSATFERAMDACKDLEPSGFTGHERSAAEQQQALAFARCVREHGVKDFPDPDPDGPLVDTNRIPSSAGKAGMSALNAAMHECGDLVASMVGDQ